MTANVASEMRKKAAQHEQTTQARGKKSSLAIRFELVMPAQAEDVLSRPGWQLAASPVVAARVA